jgi:SecD/SecF fusion protein
MTSEYILSIIIFLIGITAVGLFLWYFAAEEAPKKRLAGTILTFLLVGFGIYTLNTKPLQKGIDLAGGAAFTVKIKENDGQKVTKEQANAAKEILEKRLAPLGNKDVIITVQGDDVIYVEVPGISPEEIQKSRETIEKVAKLEFRLVNPQSNQLIQQRDASSRVVEPGWVELPHLEKSVEGEDLGLPKAAKDLKPEDAKLSREEQIKKRLEGFYAEKKTMVVKNTAEMSGKSVKDASAQPDLGTGDYLISVLLHSEFGKKMEDITKKNLEQPMAIIVDNEVISAPVIRGVFGESFQVTGKFTQKQALDLASALTNPLENPLEITQFSQTSPTYGETVIKQGVFAGIAGLIATLVFMCVYYRLAGFIAVLGLLVNLLLLLAAMIIFDFTLTMPGIAGTLLTLGIAIDANVLIYERLREEFRTGKTLNAAITAAYSKAFTAIFDSHSTSLISSIIMIAVASGAVKGFGVTLTIGIVASLFSSLLITRVCFSWLESRGLQKLSFLSLIKNRYIDFMRQRRFAIISSFALAALALVILFVKGEKSLGFELRGGDLISLTGVTEQQILDSLGDVKIASLKDGTTEPFTFTVQTNKPIGDQKEYLNLRVNPGHGDTAKAELAKDLAGIYTISDEQHAGPAVGAAALRSSIWAIVIGLFAIFVYLAFRYEVPFAIGGIVALSHDVLIVAGICALCGREIGMILIGAFLTIAGYSINDTIVIFDRIRDTLRTSPNDLTTVMNESISATLSRTILTSGVTLIVVISMYFFGGMAMQDFSFAMLIGILVGTYSSIFVASPIVLWWAKTHKLNLQKAILDADQMRLEALSGMEKEAPAKPEKPAKAEKVK